MAVRAHEGAQAIRAWSRLLLSELAKSTLMVAAALVFWAALPALWAWQPTTVASDSMAPSIRKGDVVVAMPVDPSQVRQGQVLLVNDPDVAGRMRLHRMVGVTEDGLLSLRGDANQTEDSSSVSPEQVRGVGVIRIPFAGLPGLWIGTGNFAPLVALVVGVGVLVVATRLDRTPPSRRTPRDRGRVLTGSATATLLLLVTSSTGLGGVLTDESRFARAAFTKTTGNLSDSFAAAAVFDCLHPAPADAPFFVYRFSESSGSVAVDDSGNGRDGTYQGSPTKVVGSCRPDLSPHLTFDGVNDFVSTPTLVAPPNAFSLEVWFRMPTSAAGGLLLGFGNTQSGASSSVSRALYLTDAGNLVFGVNPGVPRVITSPGAYRDNAWHLVTATFTQNNALLNLYVDGAVVATSGSGDAPSGPSGYWRIGYDSLAGWPNQPSNNYFRGRLDNPAAYTATLNSAQASAHFTAGHD